MFLFIMLSFLCYYYFVTSINWDDFFYLRHLTCSTHNNNNNNNNDNNNDNNNNNNNDNTHDSTLINLSEHLG